MRTRARTDATHAEIVKALRKVGCKVSDCSRVGQGFPDLIVRAPAPASRDFRGFEKAARILLMEVKIAKGTLTADQEKFHAEWPETIIVRSVDEALQAVGVIR